MQKECELSIITVNYNGLKDTCELMDTLPLDDTSLEVIVVDNASKNDDATIIAQRYPQVKVIRSEKNLGFAGGNNLGIKAARGKYLFFINNDTLLYKEVEREEWKEKGDVFRPLIDRLESSSKIGVVCPKIRFTWADAPIQWAGSTPLSSVPMRNRSIGFGEKEQGQYNAPHPTPYAHGAAMMVKRETIEKAGMIPENYFLYYEELDWSAMIRRAGYEIWYEPAFTIFHKESQATGQHSPLRTYYITRNRLVFVSRNVQAPIKYISYLYLMVLVGCRDIIKYALQGNGSLSKAVIKGIYHFIKQ